MNERVEHKRLLIMKILRESAVPLSSQKIRDHLDSLGMDISERTVRFHLQALDEQGLTGYKEKKGRYLTPKGQMELSRTRVYDKIGFLSSKIDNMIFKMDFDPRSAEGSVLLNVSVLDKQYRDAVEPLIAPVFASGLAHGTLMALFDEGERVGDWMIPDGMMGLGTVCSITFNGALMRAGIPVTSAFGGLLEIDDRVPCRFTAVIRYDGTSLDPLEIFITSRMTSTAGAARSGSGQIGASFREIPAAARELTEETDTLMKKRGLGGFLRLGYSGQSLLDIPTGEGLSGLVITGGLNAVAPLVENGIPIESRALSGLVGYDMLFPYQELLSRISKLKMS